MLSSLLLVMLLNLGTYGSTYPVVEPDMMTEIEQAQRNISYEEMYKKARDSYRVDIYLPDVKKKTVRTLTFNYTVPEDLIIDGQVIAQKGQVINLLEKVNIRFRYLFIKDYQLPLYKKLRTKYHNLKAVLVQGDMIELEKKCPDCGLYLANQALIDKFQITGVPSLVYQDGAKIVVEEIPYVTKH